VVPPPRDSANGVEPRPYVAFSLSRRYPPAGMTVPAGIWNLVRIEPSSDRSQLDTSTGAADRLRSSTYPAPGVAGLARTSLTTTVLTVRPATDVPGSPLASVLARQENSSPQVDAAALGSTMTSE